MSQAARSESEEVLMREDHGQVAYLTMNRPHAYNALSTGLMTAIQGELDEIRENSNVRAVVIGANGKGFCAGHDLQQIRSDKSAAYYRSVFAMCSKMMQSILSLPQPVIARVHGIATAAGCQLVATCDLAVAEEGARFGTPGVNIGLFCSTPMVGVSRNVPRKQMMEMLLLGEMMDAPTARDYGLINRVVPADRLDAEVAAIGAQIAEKSPYTLRIGKEAFYRQVEMPVGEAYEYASEVMTKNMMARDADEGIQAFVEKRKPVWTGE